MPAASAPWQVGNGFILRAFGKNEGGAGDRPQLLAEDALLRPAGTVAPAGRRGRSAPRSRGTRAAAPTGARPRPNGERVGVRGAPRWSAPSARGFLILSERSKLSWLTGQSGGK